MVNVDKQLKLEGAQAGVVAPGRSGAESIIASPNGDTELNISANNVTVNGFTIQGNTSVFVSGAGIYIEPGISGTQFLNNIVQDNVIGLDLANASTTDQAVIEGNLFQNNNNPGAGGDTDIYADNFTAGGVVQDVLAENNTFTSTTFDGNATGFGISNVGNAPFNNITLQSNTFSNIGYGIYLLNTSNSTITENTITGTTVAVALYGDDYSPTEPGNSSISITQNTLNDNGTAVLVEDGGTPASYDNGPANAPAFTGGTLDIANNFLDGNGYGVDITQYALWQRRER